MEMQTYQEVIEYLKAKKRAKHLLLGNGFSMAYDNKIFSYNALSNFISNIDNDLLKKLFAIIKTKNFELIMRQLENFSALAHQFGSDGGLEEKINEANELLKSSLINAVKALHPEHVFKMPEDKSSACAQFVDAFLSDGGHIFTTNYDILLYWVLMRNSHLTPKAIDGFGRVAESLDEYTPEEDLEYSELIWGKHKENQNIHYLHGALPIFDTGITIIKEEYDSEHYLLENIEQRMEHKDYPVFVTAGDGNDKLAHILHNHYLSFCYDKLCSIEGSLITFGFNFGDYDEHIIEAINKAAKNGKKTSNRLWSIYIGVYSKDDIQHIKRIEHKFKCKVNLYDVKTANLWG